ncbi:DUF1289 domain-containing protein [Azospirillum doebereinerae]
MSTKDTKNPCVGLCRFDVDAQCRGCHRSKAEVKGWKRMTDVEKTAINHRIRAQAAPDTRQVGDKRLRKLDRKIRKLEAKLGALKVERKALADTGPSHAHPEGRAVPLRSTNVQR